MPPALLLLLLLMPAVARAQTPATPPAGAGGKDTSNANCGLLYGKDHALTFCAPDGWVLDNTIMNDEGIYAVFYPQGSTWEQAKDQGTFMYIDVELRDPGSTVPGMMAADADQVRHSAPKSVIEAGQPISLAKTPVPVQRFLPGGFDRYEAVAYIGEEKVLVMFIVSSKSQQDLSRDYPAFVKLVQSYKFLGSNVTIQQK